MFVKLTSINDGKAVYVNAARVRGISEENNGTWVNVGRVDYVVKESANTVVTLLEAAMKGGFMA